MNETYKTKHPIVKYLKKGDIYIFIIDNKKIKARFCSEVTNILFLAFPDNNFNFINITDNRNLWVNNKLTLTIHDKITNVYKYISLKDKLDLL